MKYMTLLVLGILVAGCAERDRARGSNTGEAKPSTASVPADNTDKNERDRSGATLTPGDQGESEADRSVTQHVRSALVGDDGLSSNGKNVKIVTQDGVVTLRGPVKSAEEKAAVATLARGVSGVKRVDNQLETVAN